MKSEGFDSRTKSGYGSETDPCFFSSVTFRKTHDDYSDKSQLLFRSKTWWLLPEVLMMT